MGLIVAMVIHESSCTVSLYICANHTVLDNDIQICWNHPFNRARIEITRMLTRPKIMSRGGLEAERSMCRQGFRA
jgi:hypothetical protein